MSDEIVQTVLDTVFLVVGVALLVHAAFAYCALIRFEVGRAHKSTRPNGLAWLSAFAGVACARLGAELLFGDTAGYVT